MSKWFLNLASKCLSKLGQVSHIISLIEVWAQQRPKNANRNFAKYSPLGTALVGSSLSNMLSMFNQSRMFRPNNTKSMVYVPSFLIRFTSAIRQK